MRDNISRLGSTLIGLLVVVALALGYWQFVKAPELATRPGNPRLLEEAARALRGSVVDRNGELLAYSVVTPDGVERRYPHPAAAPVTGYYSLRYGRSGIEAAFDDQLSGARSPDLLERLRAEVLHERIVGSDVHLTIDARIQRVAAEALGENRGAVVVLDPRTGAVLALAQQPHIDPNTVDQRWDRLVQDPERPLFNRPLQATYVPGSTFKTVVAAAAVDLGLVDLERRFSCTRPVRIGDLAPDCRNHAHLPSLTFSQAFAWSSNRAHALLALGLGYRGPLDLSDNPEQPYPWERGGIEPSVERLREYARRFGFGREIPFDLPVEPSRLADSEQVFFPSLLAQTGFGQGQVAATPLQMALVAATIANDGVVPRPYLVSTVQAPGGATTQINRPGGWLDRAVSSETAARINEMMELSVEAAYAQKAQVVGVKVAGKTGTAEIGEGRQPNSWFIGYAPSDDPRVAVAVVMEEKGSGSEFATPVAQRVLAAALAAYPDSR